MANPSYPLLRSLGFCLLACLGCGSADDEASKSDTTLSCASRITSPVTSITSDACTLFEATGPDAARLIASLREGCVDQEGLLTAQVVDSCPAAGNVGGCEHPVEVEGGADVELIETNFYYELDPDQSTFGAPPSTPEAVELRCSQTLDGVFIPAP